jgi:hypothetical protein
MSDYWFKPKTYGVGVTPSNWKGWAAIGGLGLVIVILIAAMLLPPVLHGVEPSPTRVVLFIALETLAIIAFFFIARRKTDGEWRWSWRKGP